MNTQKGKEGSQQKGGDKDVLFLMVHPEAPGRPHSSLFFRLPSTMLRHAAASLLRGARDARSTSGTVRARASERGEAKRRPAPALGALALVAGAGPPFPRLAPPPPPPPLVAWRVHAANRLAPAPLAAAAPPPTPASFLGTDAMLSPPLGRRLPRPPPAHTRATMSENGQAPRPGSTRPHAPARSSPPSPPPPPLPPQRAYATRLTYVPDIDGARVRTVTMVPGDGIGKKRRGREGDGFFCCFAQTLTPLTPTPLPPL